jgi:hypothetical protein
MPRVRYVASVSGGSWFTTLYYYYQPDFEVVREGLARSLTSS